MSKEIIVKMGIDGKDVKSFQSLSVSQQFNAHHSFELVLDEDSMFDENGQSIVHRYIGKSFMVQFGQSTPDDNVFKGFITEVGLAQSDGLWGNLILKGSSPTILLEGGEDYKSYYKKKLPEIIKSTVESAESVLGLENNPAFKSEITYMCQYGESNFAFINRLAVEYGEWFYYNGAKLFFGRPTQQEVIQLTYGSDVSSLNFAVKVVPAKVNHYSYQSQHDEVLTAQLPNKVEGIGIFAKQALEAADKLYPNAVIQPVSIRTSTQKDLDDFTKKQKARLASQTVILKLEGDNPLAQIGRIAEIKTLKREGKSSDFEDYGSFLITSITHTIKGTGAYTHSLEAIPELNEQTPFDKVKKPIAETQVAIVKDNKDPQKQGRVRVQMLWQQKSGQLTDWLRVLTPDAGGSEKVKQNRGFVFISEIGDQVAVAFRYNDPNRPFVIGSLFHGKTGGGGSDNNHSKSLTTRTGSTILLNDAAHTVTMQTSNGNTIKVDEKSGAVTISSGSSVSISSKSISITGSESVSIMSPSISIGSLGGKKPTDTVKVEGKAVNLNGENTLGATSKEVTINGTDKLNEYGGKYLMQVAEASIDGGSKIAMSSDQTDIA